jgi:DNA polymerase-3 subunit alpha
MDLIPEYIARKHRKHPVPSVHPIVDKFTAETYGVMVYQEQVMQIVHELGDIPLRQAYTLIKAISKKKIDIIDSARGGFIDGASKKGLGRDEAEELFELILKFAGYGFNKSHSTGYAIIAYQTAWLKTWFPVQYMAAVLTFESGARKIEDWAPYLDDCRRTRYSNHVEGRPNIGIEVRGPDINESRHRFTVVHDEHLSPSSLNGAIRFGLGGIKGAGKNAVEALIAERDANGPFSSIWDLCDRAPAGTVNRGTMEALIKAGALDSVHGMSKRAAMVREAESALRAGQKLKRDADSGQGQLFGGEDIPDGDTEQFALPDVPPWSDREALAYERELLGFHISGHPIDEHDATFKTYCTCTIARLGDMPMGRQIRLGVMIASTRIVTIQRGRNAGQRMVMMTLQDRAASIEAVMFSDHFARDGDMAVADAVVIAEGHVDINNRSGDRQFIVERLLRPAEAARLLTEQIELRVPFKKGESQQAASERIRMTAGIIRQAGSSQIAGGAHTARVVLHLDLPDQLVTLKSGLRVVPHDELVRQLTEMLGGREQIQLVGSVPRARSNRRERYSKKKSV